MLFDTFKLINIHIPSEKYSAAFVHPGTRAQPGLRAPNPVRHVPQITMQVRIALRASCARQANTVPSSRRPSSARFARSTIMHPKGSMTLYKLHLSKKQAVSRVTEGSPGVKDQVFVTPAR